MHSTSTHTRELVIARDAAIVAVHSFFWAAMEIAIVEFVRGDPRHRDI